MTVKRRLLILLSSILITQPLYAKSEVEELKDMVKSLTKRIAVLENKSSSHSLKKPHNPHNAELPVPTTKSVEKDASSEPIHLVKSRDEKLKVTLQGMIHRGALYVDNSKKSKLFSVDNDNDPSRVTVLADGKFNEDISVQAATEVAPIDNSTADIDIRPNGISRNYVHVRRAEVSVTSKTAGTIFLGRGDTTTYNIPEYDISGTDAPASGAGVAYLAEGITFIDRLNPTPIGPTVIKAWDDMDGLGQASRIRYDTPQFGIFTLGTSYSNTNSGDVALKWDADTDGTKIQGGVGFGKKSENWRQISGSNSILFPCGLSITGAGGFRNHFKNTTGTSRSSAKYIFGKLGYKYKLFSFGYTAIAANLGFARNMTANSQKTTTYGYALVQHIDSIATEVYVTGQWYDLDQTGTNFGKITATMLGVRIKF